MVVGLSHLFLPRLHEHLRLYRSMGAQKADASQAALNQGLKGMFGGEGLPTMFLRRSKRMRYVGATFKCVSTISSCCCSK